MPSLPPAVQPFEDQPYDLMKKTSDHTVFHRSSMKKPSEYAHADHSRRHGQQQVSGAQEHQKTGAESDHSLGSGVQGTGYGE